MKSSLIYFQPNSPKNILGLNAEYEVLVSRKEDFNKLDNFFHNHKDRYIFGWINYDVKNQFEDLTSQNQAFIDFPLAYFYVPKLVARKNDIDEVEYLEKTPSPEERKLVNDFFNDLKKTTHSKVTLQPTLSKDDYVTRVTALKEHIQLGDIYEVTYCQDFRSNSALIQPRAVFGQLNAITNSPNACYVEFEDKFLICGSPERFLQLTDRRLVSQPIKGTARRHSDSKADEQSKKELLTSQKERSENVMIVDLVRNDLSRIAEKGSVHVDELFGIYSFPTVHQMISTISCELVKNLKFTEILRALFPMGSMTGAPKIRAMQLIDQYEDFQRGLFSGSVGVKYPNGDFDFNVIIRSILYDETTQRISCPVGSAITSASDPEQEYQECLTKIDAMKRVLKHE
jgi:para-aminobenzoate synthetase component I